MYSMDAVKLLSSGAQPEVMIEQLTSPPKTYTGESMSVAATLNHRIRQKGCQYAAAAQVAGVRRYLRQSIAF